MTIKLHRSVIAKRSEIIITGSKSESNRLLLLQALFTELSISNVSNSDDSEVMQSALNSNSSTIDIHHAGTAMRFLTAYFAALPEREVVLTGSDRMKERPIAVLVDALRSLGAEIHYLENEGCPPLSIKGKELHEWEVSLNANVSSQYISALLLIAPKLKHGLKLNLVGEITSRPYIEMTLSLLDRIGVVSEFNENVITVQPQQDPLKSNALIVESDWSSASYYYSIVALSPIGTHITLSSYFEDSLQGDSALAELYTEFGVKTTFKDSSIVLEKVSTDIDASLEFHLNNSPDIAQTIAVTCLGLGVNCFIDGLHTLKIKETDRLVALKNELEKFGSMVEISNDSLELRVNEVINSDVIVETYNDHRMAMAFAPMALKTDLFIEDHMVVSKSYPDFWNDLKSIGLTFSK